MQSLQVDWCDRDEEFATMLAAYCRRHYRGRLEICPRRDPAGISGAPLKVVMADLYDPSIRGSEQQLVLLHDGYIPKELEEEPLLYRYQPADELLSFLLQLGAGEGAEIVCRTGTTEIYGVLGAAGTEVSLAAGLAAADICSEKKNTLLLDLSQCSGMQLWLGKTEAEHVGELLYLQRIGAGFGQKERALEAALCHDQRFDYILPDPDPEHLLETGGREYTGLLDFLTEGGRYGSIIVVLGPIVCHFPEVLRQMKKVLYLQQGGTGTYENRAFRTYLDAAQRPGEDLCGKLVEIRMAGGGEPLLQENMQLVLHGRAREAVEAALEEDA